MGGGFSPRELGWELKALGFAKAQEEVGMSSQACWRAASLPLPISSYPKCFHPSSSSHPPQFPPRMPVLFTGWGCGVLYGGCCGKEDGGTDPGTDPNLRSPSGFLPGAEEREEGGVWDMAGRGERILHKPEAIQEQLPVAWKHLCDSRQWERRCIYLRIYITSSQNNPPQTPLILCFLFIDIKEAQEGPGGLR